MSVRLGSWFLFNLGGDGYISKVSHLMKQFNLPNFKLQSSPTNSVSLINLIH